MDIIDATAEALLLLFSGDAELWRIIALSLTISLSALLCISPPALICAYLLAVKRFRGRQLLLSLLHGFLSFPTVVIGLILYIMLSHNGPLGALELLFTPQAMALGQMIIAFPVLTAFVLPALQSNMVHETAYSLGAGKIRVLLTACSEARFAVVAAFFAGFGRVISEVGCALLVGGNIAHYTRTITTTITLDTGKGAFTESIALGFVLVLLTIFASVILSVVQDNDRH